MRDRKPSEEQILGITKSQVKPALAELQRVVDKASLLAIKLIDAVLLLEAEPISEDLLRAIAEDEEHCEAALRSCENFGFLIGIGKRSTATYKMSSIMQIPLVNMSKP
ncbi:MAG: hypothetical protein MRQ09_05850 [Candidatus Midichloria sp.]|nr:hypothetical protein [Candidatus Midichloria sp.]